MRRGQSPSRFGGAKARWSMLKWGNRKRAANVSEPSLSMDCRVKPGNDEIENSFSRRASARALFDSFLPPQRGEAERRQAQPSFVRAAQQVLPLACAAGAEARPSERARLSALHRGSRLGDRTPPLSLGPRFLEKADANGLLALSAASAASSSRTGRNAGRAGSRSRPGAGLRNPPAGAALAPPQDRIRMRPLDERASRLVTEVVTDVKHYHAHGD